MFLFEFVEFGEKRLDTFVQLIVVQILSLTVNRLDFRLFGVDQRRSGPLNLRFVRRRMNFAVVRIVVGQFAGANGQLQLSVAFGEDRIVQFVFVDQLGREKSVEFLASSNRLLILPFQIFVEEGFRRSSNFVLSLFGFPG